LGGLSKKATLIKKLINEPQQPALIITGGNMLFTMGRLAPEAGEAAKIAADTVLLAHQKMGATFAGIGTQDLEANVAFLRQYQNPPAFTWLSLNLIDPRSHAPLFTPVIQRRVGEVNIAILALTDHTAFPQEPGDFQVVDWRKSLPEALATIKKESDFVLLLSNYSLSENMEIARSHPSIDLILQAGHALGNMTPTVVNKTLIGQTEIRGKYLGVMDITWNGRGQWQEEREKATTSLVRDKKQSASTYANRFIALKLALANDPEIETLVKQAQWRIEKRQHGLTR
jgi:2',3'-cyclic-nucleotide 2'-phosphodiesterase (5'-nucleotidase family)